MADGPGYGETVDKLRLASFSDNVISIAMTLLVLDVRLPSGLDRVGVGQALHLLAPKLMGFALSFTIVGVFWVGHHLMIRGMAEASRALLWANNLFLLFVSLIPASAALLGGHPEERASAVLYGSNLVLVGSSLLLLFHMSVRFHGRFGLPMRRDHVLLAYTRTAGGVAIALLGIGLAWVSPYVSYAVYLLTPIGFIVVQLRPVRPQATPPAGR